LFQVSRDVPLRQHTGILNNVQDLEALPPALALKI